MGILYVRRGSSKVWMLNDSVMERYMDAGIDFIFDITLSLDKAWAS
jgi:hypothetical protein